tara:strand:- start:174 stop:1157 length:984 start_codon:yes stop_codon:yes gene_type:complete
MHEETINALGEKELIKRISKYMPENQTSDDCAFIKNNKKGLLINIDNMVENTHFDNNINPRDIGWKAATSNFSDLISSGCQEIIGINIGLIIPSYTHWKWVEEIYEGLNEALNEFGGSILGGDCSKGDNRSIVITSIGIQSELKLRRNACKAGEVLLSSGNHGLSKLGFLLITQQINHSEFKLSESLIQKAIQNFCRPKPKNEVLTQIINTKESSSKKEVGCTDSSDGFYQAVEDLAIESNCKAVIDYEKIPKANDWPYGSNWDNYYFFGGEDYELIFSLPKKWANRLLTVNPTITEIGYLIEGDPKVEIKNCPNSDLLKNQPFSHF